MISNVSAICQNVFVEERLFCGCACGIDDRKSNRAVASFAEKRMDKKVAVPVVLAFAGFGFAYLRRYRGGRVALSVQYELRNAMHDHLQTMDDESLARMPTGQLVSRANSDSTLVQGLLSFLPRPKLPKEEEDFNHQDPADPYHGSWNENRTKYPAV